MTNPTFSAVVSFLSITDNKEAIRIMHAPSISSLKPSHLNFCFNRKKVLFFPDQDFSRHFLLLN